MAINNIPNDIKTLLENDCRTFREKITIGDKEYTEFRNFKITQGIENGSTISIGSTFSSMLEVTLANVEKETISKMSTINAYVGVKTTSNTDDFDNDDSYYYFQTGQFYIDQLETNDKDLRIVAYDGFYKLQNTLFSDLKGLVKISDILTEQLTKYGLSYDNENSGDLSIKFNADVLAGISIREAIGYLASYLGRNAVFNEKGKLVFKKYKQIDRILEEDRFSEGVKLGEKGYVVNKLRCLFGYKETAQDGTVNEYTTVLESGAKSKTISRVTSYFAYSNSDTQTPTKWLTNRSFYVWGYKYLWAYEDVLYSDGKTETTKKRVVFSNDSAGDISIKRCYAVTSADTKNKDDTDFKIEKWNLDSTHRNLFTQYFIEYDYWTKEYDSESGKEYWKKERKSEYTDSEKIGSYLTGAEAIQSYNAVTFNHIYMSQTELDRIAKEMFSSGGIYVENLSLNWSLFEPNIQVGDIITIIDEGMSYHIPIMKLTYEIDGGCFGTLESFYQLPTGEGGSSSFQGSLSQKVDNVYSDLGNFKKITSDNVVALQGNFHNLEADNANFKETTTETINAVNGNIETINSKVANIESGYIKKLEADETYSKKTETDEIKAKVGQIDEINSSIQNIKEQVVGKATIEELNVEKEKVKKLEAEKADINFANVNVANVNEQFVKDLMVQGKMIVQDGTVYRLSAIKINADDIDVGTLKADRILLTGEDGLFYNLNYTSLGEAKIQALSEEEQIRLQRTIHADTITAHSITTEHITTQDLSGTGGWINLANGTFNYSSAESGEGISWDGEHLIINATDLEINLKDFINNTTSRTTNLELSTENISQELREHKNSTDSRISSITQNYEKIVSDIEKVNETLVGSGNVLKELNNLSIVLEPNETNLFTNNGSILRLGLIGTNKFSFYKESNFESVYTDEEIYSLGLSVECELGGEQHKITVKAGDKELTFKINDTNKDLVLNNISFKDNHILEISSEDTFYLLIGKMRLIKGDQYTDKTQGLLSIGTTVEQNDATIKFLTKKLETQKDLLTNQINDLKSLRKFIIINDEKDDDASIILATSTKSDGTPNGFYSKWTNKGLYFYQNWGDETPIAFFTNNELQINRSVVVESMRIGSYEWIPLVNNNGDDILVLRYLGGKS